MTIYNYSSYRGYSLAIASMSVFYDHQLSSILKSEINEIREDTGYPMCACFIPGDGDIYYIRYEDMKNENISHTLSYPHLTIYNNRKNAILDVMIHSDRRQERKDV